MASTMAGELVSLIKKWLMLVPRQIGILIGKDPYHGIKNLQYVITSRNPMDGGSPILNIIVKLSWFRTWFPSR